MPISYRLGVIAIWKNASYLLSLGPNFATPQPPTPSHTVDTHPYSREFFFKVEWFPPWVRGKPSTKNEVDRFNIVWDIWLTDWHAKCKVSYPAMQSNHCLVFWHRMINLQMKHTIASIRWGWHHVVLKSTICNIRYQYLYMQMESFSTKII